MSVPGPKKVILVDDRESVLKMVKEFLESSGFTIKAFDDPNAAPHEVTTAGADVVVYDYNMRYDRHSIGLRRDCRGYRQKTWCKKSPRKIEGFSDGWSGGI
jgi:DNA-binding response OmpR family regulator